MARPMFCCRLSSPRKFGGLGAAWIVPAKSTPAMAAWNVPRMVFFMMMLLLICALFLIKIQQTTF